jgi:hypothetical protein
MTTAEAGLFEFGQIDRGRPSPGSFGADFD